MQTEAVAPISAVVFGSIPCLLSVFQAALMPHLRQSCARSQGVFLKAHSGERLQICLKLNGCDFVGASSPEWLKAPLSPAPQKSHSVGRSRTFCPTVPRPHGLPCASPMGGEGRRQKSSVKHGQVTEKKKGKAGCEFAGSEKPSRAWPSSSFASKKGGGGR